MEGKKKIEHFVLELENVRTGRGPGRIHQGHRARRVRLVC